MRLHLTHLVVICALVGQAAVAEAQDSASNATRSGGRPFSFTQTPDGSWKTTLRSADGRESEFVFVPGTKLTPEFRNKVVLEDPRSSRFSYSWRMINHAVSVQQLAQVRVSAIPQLTIRREPVGWHVFPHSGAFIMFGPVDDGKNYSSGIPPGSEDVVEFEAENALPGPQVAVVLGDVDPAPPMPEGLSPSQEADLSVLRVQELRVRTIAPAIPAGRREPELDAKVLATRVALAYRSELVMAKHPQADDFGAEFERLLAGEPRQWTSTLQRIRALTQRPVVDPWQKELSEALGLCIEALIRGDVPLKDAPR